MNLALRGTRKGTRSKTDRQIRATVRHMAKRAIILGGTGAIGGATAERLARAGWTVDVTGRNPGAMPAELSNLGVTFRRLDWPERIHRATIDSDAANTDPSSSPGHSADLSSNPGDSAHPSFSSGTGRGTPTGQSTSAELRNLVGSGADLIVDTLAFSVSHLRTLMPVLSDVDAAAVISARAVYADKHGHHLNSEIPGHFPHPVREDHDRVAADRTVNPFTREGYARARAAVEDEILGTDLPITLIRPSKVYGKWARNPRTRYFVDRMSHNIDHIRIPGLDLHADQLTAAANIAQLIDALVNSSGSHQGHPHRPHKPRVLNCADPSIPTMRELAHAIAAALDWNGQILAAEDESPENAPEPNPFLARTPLHLDLTRATAAGYEPVGTTLDLIGLEARWLRDQQRA